MVKKEKISVVQDIIDYYSENQMKIIALYPTHIKQYGVGYVCQSLIEAMKSTGLDCQLYSVSTGKEILKEYIRNTLNPNMEKFGYKLLSGKNLRVITEWKFINKLTKNDIGYLWPAVTLATIEKAHLKSYSLILERINTHQETSKAILDKEYKKLGLEPEHGITTEHIDLENKKIELVDHLFSPSKEVTKSLIKADVPAEKIIETSYGLKSSDILESTILLERQKRKKLTGLFVGRIGIRKGIHLLLKYWVDSGVEGTLKLVGNIEPGSRHLIEPYLKRSDIEHIEFVSDLNSLYREADVFLFPSLEEGSPIVTYHAIGAGLPCLVSPMGAGGIISHDKEGLIMDPHDSVTWINSLIRIFNDSELRSRLALNAHILAPEYLWINVGRKRVEMLTECLKNR